MTLVWPEFGWNDQDVLIQDLQNRIELVDLKTSPATYINSNEPASDTVLDTAWAIKKGGNTRVPDDSKTQWFNPATLQVENIFVKLDPISPFAQPLIGRRQPTPLIEVIGQNFVTKATGVQATITFTISKTYTSWILLGRFRSDAAGAASDTLLIRPNNVATATYQALVHRVQSTATFDRVSTVNGTSLGGANLVVPAEGGNTPNHIYAALHANFPYPMNRIMSFYRFSSFWDDGGAAEQTLIIGAGSLNSPPAITSLVLDLTTGNFQLGSWAILYGIL